MLKLISSAGTILNNSTFSKPIISPFVVVISTIFLSAHENIFAITSADTIVGTVLSFLEHQKKVLFVYHVYSTSSNLPSINL